MCSRLSTDWQHKLQHNGNLQKKKAKFVLEKRHVKSIECVTERKRESPTRYEDKFFMVKILCSHLFFSAFNINLIMRHNLYVKCFRAISESYKRR